MPVTSTADDSKYQNEETKSYTDSLYTKMLGSTHEIGGKLTETG